MRRGMVAEVRHVAGYWERSRNGISAVSVGAVSDGVDGMAGLGSTTGGRRCGARRCRVVAQSRPAAVVEVVFGSRVAAVFTGVVAGDGVGREAAGAGVAQPVASRSTGQHCAQMDRAGNSAGAERVVRNSRSSGGREQQRARSFFALELLQQRVAANARKCPSGRLPEKRVVISVSDSEAALGLDKLGSPPTMLCDDLRWHSEWFRNCSLHFSVPHLAVSSAVNWKVLTEK